MITKQQHRLVFEVKNNESNAASIKVIVPKNSPLLREVFMVYKSTKIRFLRM